MNIAKYIFKFSKSMQNALFDLIVVIIYVNNVIQTKKYNE